MGKAIYPLDQVRPWPLLLTYLFLYRRGMESAGGGDSESAAQRLQNQADFKRLTT